MSNQYNPRGRFETPSNTIQFDSPYDISSAELQDAIQRRTEPFFVVTLSLATARTVPLELPPGQAIVIYGHDGSAIRTVNTTACVYMQLNQFDASKFDSLNSTSGVPFGFPMKHARGFRGPFAKALLTWPAQGGVFCDVVIHRFRGEPWVDGESAT